MQIDSPSLALLPRYDLFLAALRQPLVRTNLSKVSMLFLPKHLVIPSRKPKIDENLGPSYVSREIFQKDLDRNFP